MRKKNIHQEKSGNEIVGKLKLVMTSSNNRNNYSLPALVAVLLVTLISFYPCINNDFTNWDDEGYIVNNSSLSKNKLTDYFVKDKFIKGNYHPLTMITYSMEYAAVKLKPRLYHWDNLLIHLLNTASVFWLILLLTGAPLSAAFAAFLFGVHPMHVESVAWVSERKDVLYTFFFLASIISYLFYLRNKKILFYVFCFLLFVLSLLSKGQAVTLPIILLLVDYFCNRPFNWKILYEKVPLFILSLIFGLIAVYAQSSTTHAMTLTHSFGESILFASYGLLSYIYKLLLPFDLSCFYPYPVKSNGFYPLIFYIAPVISVGGGILFYYKFNKNKNFVFGSLFFLVTIFPVLQLLPIGRSITADRYSYIPYIGLFFILGQVLNYFFGQKTENGKIVFAKNTVRIKNGFVKNKILILLTIFAICIYAYAGNQRCGVWKNSVTLWSDAAESNANNPEAFDHLGGYYAGEAEKKKKIGAVELYNQFFNKAIENFKQCIALDSTNKNAPMSLGFLYNGIGKYKGAKNFFTLAIKVNPLYSQPWSNRSMAELNLGEYDNALRDINRAILISPEYREYYFIRGTVLLNKKLFKEAIRDLKEVINSDPNHKETKLNLGLCYGGIGMLDSAIFFYNKIIQQDSSIAFAFFKRACANADLKKYNEAISDFNSVLKISPNDTTTYLLRSKTYLLMNDKKAAINDATKAKNLGMKVPETYLRQLAN